MRTAIVILLIVILLSCMIGDVLPGLSDKARAGDNQAVFLVFGGVFAVLLGVGACLIILTTITGGVDAD